MISKTKIDKKMKRKTNPELVKLVRKLRKSKGWIGVANILSYPRRKKIEKNIDELNKEAEENITIVVPGKVLGGGDVNKKIKVVAFSFSKEALRKLKGKHCEALSIEEELNKNHDGKGLKILK
ncbi:50S ribosomal protein L18e [Candidatus Pacearchaeota archaeon]|nr:50S ribosomal protein L18e [Candidatus Pacearchaeota archaeon]